MDTQRYSELDVNEEPEYVEGNLQMTRSALYCSHSFKYRYPPSSHHSCLKDDYTNPHMFASTSTICIDCTK